MVVQKSFLEIQPRPITWTFLFPRFCPSAPLCALSTGSLPRLTPLRWGESRNGECEVTHFQVASQLLPQSPLSVFWPVLLTHAFAAAAPVGPLSDLGNYRGAGLGQLGLKPWGLRRGWGHMHAAIR